MEKIKNTIKDKLATNMYFKILVDLKSNRGKLNSLLFFFFIWNTIRHGIKMYKFGTTDKLDKKDYSVVMIIISSIYFVSS